MMLSLVSRPLSYINVLLTLLSHVVDFMPILHLSYCRRAFFSQSPPSFWLGPGWQCLCFARASQFRCQVNSTIRVGSINKKWRNKSWACFRRHSTELSCVLKETFSNPRNTELHVPDGGGDYVLNAAKREELLTEQLFSWVYAQIFGIAAVQNKSLKAPCDSHFQIFMFNPGFQRSSLTNQLSPKLCWSRHI